MIAEPGIHLLKFFTGRFVNQTGHVRDIQRFPRSRSDRVAKIDVDAGIDFFHSGKVVSLCCPINGCVGITAEKLAAGIAREAENQRDEQRSDGGKTTHASFVIQGNPFEANRNVCCNCQEIVKIPGEVGY